MERKVKKIYALVRNDTQWAIREIIEELYFFFSKILKNLQIDDWTKGEKVALYKIVLTLNRQKHGDAISPTVVKWKVRTRPTYSKSW